MRRLAALPGGGRSGSERPTEVLTVVVCTNRRTAIFYHNEEQKKKAVRTSAQHYPA